VGRPSRILLGLSLAVVVAGVGAAAALAQPEDEREPVVVAADPFELRGEGQAAELVPVHHFVAAEVMVPELVAFAVPNPAAGTVPVATKSNPTAEGWPLVVSVLESTDDLAWHHVRLPLRPNGLTGWVRASDVRVFQIANRVEVTLSTHTLRVYEGDSDRVLFETDVATGRPNTPTPTGDFYIDIVNPLFGHRVYGWGQLSVSGFSDVLERFAGGIGQIAIHGWNDDSVMGTASSNGCVRMRNADMARVAELAAIGSPVRIVP
jgi:hypothetical protein